MIPKEFNDWLQVIGIFGVLGGLILVAIELRQTNAAIRASAYQFRAESSTNWDVAIGESPERASMILKYLDGGREALNREEDLRYGSLLRAAFKRQESEYYQYELGLLDDVWYETTFRHHMELWVPRWRDWGELENDAYIAEVARPSFWAEIQRFVDLPDRDRQRYLYER